MIKNLLVDPLSIWEALTAVHHKLTLASSGEQMRFAQVEEVVLIDPSSVGQTLQKHLTCEAAELARQLVNAES